MRIVKAGNAITTQADWPAPKGKELHWKPGRSAMECMRAWLPADGRPCIPAGIACILASRFPGVTIEEVEPECKIRFDTLRGEPRNADIAAIASCAGGNIAITVEAKADEPFGPTVTQTLEAARKARALNDRSGAEERVTDLARRLFNASCEEVGSLRYQLLTAAAGTLAYADANGARQAVLIVHEFWTDCTTDANHTRNATDFADFIQRLSGQATDHVQCGTLYGPFDTKWLASLYVGKVVDCLRAERPCPCPIHAETAV